ncbi:UNVERIFIED_CONTAM: hypothetical protein Slati_3017700 [Sesamum latifolium]|uniref:Uncharacterized protein n=1 Tax=Sesamum latifolium TaxID=2727402 RepID=A0AAW2VHL9_9LAMI
MFIKLIHDQVSGNLRGRAAATAPPTRSSKDSLTSSDSNAKRPAIMTLGASSKCAKLSSMGALPISFTRQATTPRPPTLPPPRDSGTKVNRLMWGAPFSSSGGEVSFSMGCPKEEIGGHGGASVDRKCKVERCQERDRGRYL